MSNSIIIASATVIYIPGIVLILLVVSFSGDCAYIEIFRNSHNL